MATFINRQKELAYLKNWLNQEPNSLLFVYGPKSSGKTSLITQLIEYHLNLKKMAINYMNLRGVLLYDFSSFLDTFFTKTTKGKFREILAGVSINLGFFKVGLDDEALLKQNPFRVMEGQLTTAKKKGLMPVLIIDEIQNLKSSYLNGERYLLDELFNLFVRLTKELHVAHVLLLTSDSYFLEDIYTNAKLKKTVRFLMIDHLEKTEVLKWLSAEGLSSEDSSTVYNYLGGSPWEITECLKLIAQGRSVTESCAFFVQEEWSKLQDYFLWNIPSDHSKEIIHQVHQSIADEGYYLINDDANLQPILRDMVDQNFWFYKADERKIVANSPSIRNAICRMVG
ncbi:MAG: ATP-binding protein [Bacteroidota bacterium]